jgi:hypothetical protein
VQSFDEFLKLLEDARWGPAGYIDDAVMELLTELGGGLDILHQEVLSWAARNLEYRGLRSHETATHYKWFVYYHKRLTYRARNRHGFFSHAGPTAFRGVTRAA